MTLTGNFWRRKILDDTVGGTKRLRNICYPFCCPVTSKMSKAPFVNRYLVLLNMRTTPTSVEFLTRPSPTLPLRCRTISSCIACNTHQYPDLNQRRSFFKPSSLDGIFATSTPLRQLTHSRVLPYPRASVFNALVSVDKYPSFLPFVLSANISEVDENNLPARASLKVGYDAMGIEENWDSILNVEKEEGIIEARSADTEEDKSDGLFEVLKTRWQLQKMEDVRGQRVGLGTQTAVRLDVEVKFRSAIYDKLFAGVEEKVAGMMVGAFEKRIKELAAS